MRTPINDFITEYVNSKAVRLHMPGHKGKNFLGCEARDITEISGADALYEASGIIKESEANAAALFGTEKTLYSTEGSSQCVRAMLELARRWWQKNKSTGVGNAGDNKKAVRPVVVAARNVHKAFLYAVIALDFDVVWLMPEEENPSLCSCTVTPDTLETVLKEQGDKVAAVYLTSPNYLGGMADVSAMAKVCHEHTTMLLVDNAHGAYLHFLEKPLHPMDLGADLCCDSAHKTLPVLTGGAYLHISKTAPRELTDWAKGAMELFGSTSPSYLILQSLDLCNRYLAEGYRERLQRACEWIAVCKGHLQNNGWQTEETDPLRITVKMPAGLPGRDLAKQLGGHQIECEFADEDYLVFMATPENPVGDFERLHTAMGKNTWFCKSRGTEKKIPLPTAAKQVMSMREAYFSAGETIPVCAAAGRICRQPSATCPPAIPVVAPGELIEEAAIESFLYYGIEQIDVIK